MKTLFTLLALSVLIFPAIAQTPDCGDGYTLSSFTDAYQELDPDTAISLNNGNIWFANPWHISIGFDFTYWNHTIQDLSFGNYGVFIGDILDESLNYTGQVVPLSIFLIDKGMEDYVNGGGDLYDTVVEDVPGSMSPLLYETTGTVGNRIFKLEWKDAALEAEFDSFGEDETIVLEGFVNMQLWFYENGNVIEYRFGEISDPLQTKDYPLSGMVCFIDNQGDDGTGESVFATEDPTNPVILELPPNAEYDPNYYDVEGNLFGLPQNGMVYRWENATVSIKEESPTEVLIYPMPFSDYVSVSTSEQIDKIELCDLTGKFIHQEAVQYFSASINTAGLSPGVYLIRITCGTEVVSRVITK